VSCDSHTSPYSFAKNAGDSSTAMERRSLGEGSVASKKTPLFAQLSHRNGIGLALQDNLALPQREGRNARNGPQAALRLNPPGLRARAGQNGSALRAASNKADARA